MSLADAVTSIVEEMEKTTIRSQQDYTYLTHWIGKLRLVLKAAECQPTVPARNDMDFHRQQIERAKLDLRTKTASNNNRREWMGTAPIEDGKAQIVARGQLAEAMDNIAIVKGGRLDGDSCPIPPGTVDGTIHAIGGQEYEYRAGAYHYKGDLK